VEKEEGKNEESSKEEEAPGQRLRKKKDKRGGETENPDRIRTTEGCSEKPDRNQKTR